MKPLAKQRCFHVQRKLDSISMHREENHFDMELFHHEIIANGERFPIADIFDISFYPKKTKTDDAYRFLYLHTKSGIRTYHVREIPKEFIRVFKKLMNGELDCEQNNN